VDGTPLDSEENDEFIEAQPDEDDASGKVAKSRRRPQTKKRSSIQKTRFALPARNWSNPLLRADEEIELAEKITNYSNGAIRERLIEQLERDPHEWAEMNYLYQHFVIALVVVAKEKMAQSNLRLVVSDREEIYESGLSFSGLDPRRKSGFDPRYKV